MYFSINNNKKNQTVVQCISDKTSIIDSWLPRLIYKEENHINHKIPQFGAKLKSVNERQHQNMLGIVF